jgi:PIN domain nuclease of toxin-antitoxin system
MKLLLDTHSFLWMITDDPALSAAARDAITTTENEVWLSAASAWEIAIKYGLGKLPLPEEPDRYVPRMRERSGVDLLPIGEPEVCQLHRLPLIHRDPFDRVLVAQANCHGMVIVTDDPVVCRYPVQTLW